MDLPERIAFVRKAAGLSQEQLGQALGVTRQAVSKWESGQSIPDTATVARLCQQLQVSADFVLLGVEPEEQDSAPEVPEICECCGRRVSGSLCAVCGYLPPTRPVGKTRYAVIALWNSFSTQAGMTQQLVKYCGFDESQAQAALESLRESGIRPVLRRHLSDAAALWITSHLDQEDFSLRIVEDADEPEEELRKKESVMGLPPPIVAERSGLGFGGTVLAVVLGILAAVILLSFL